MTGRSGEVLPERPAIIIRTAALYGYVGSLVNDWQRVRNNRKGTRDCTVNSAIGHVRAHQQRGRNYEGAAGKEGVGCISDNKTLCEVVSGAPS